MFRSVPWVWGKGSLGDDRGCWMVAALARDRMDNEASSFSFDAIIFLLSFFLHLKECIHATQRTTRGWDQRIANEGMENQNE